MSSLKNFIGKHSGWILTISGILSMGTGVYATVKGTLKAKDIVDSELERRREEDPEIEKLPFKDIFKLTWKCFAPALGLFSTSCVCHISACAKSEKKIAVLSAIGSAGNITLQNCKETIKEVVGEKKEREIEDKSTRKLIEKNPLVSEDQIVETGKGKTVFYDSWSGRYFYAEKVLIDEVVKYHNKIVESGDDVYLNDIYYDLNLKEVTSGRYVKWSKNDDSLRRHKIEVMYSSPDVDDLISINKAIIVVTFKNYIIEA